MRRSKLPGPVAAVLVAALLPLAMAASCHINPAGTTNTAAAKATESGRQPAPTDSRGFPKLSDGQISELRGILMDGQCQLFLGGDRGWLIYPDRHMEGVIVVRCLYTTFQQTTVITGDKRNPGDGQWQSKGVYVSADAPVGGNVNNEYVVHIDQCENGVWSILAYITGIGYDKKTPYSTGVAGARTPPLATNCAPNVDAEGNPL